MEKLNIAELLKDCPIGMELDCTMFKDVYFDCVEQENDIIKCYIQNNDYKISISFTKYGCYTGHEKSKCVIFPKGKTTWEGFQRPFKDGDVVFYDDNIAIFKEWGDSTLFRTYVKLYIHRTSIDKDFPLFGKGIRRAARLATEKEKQKLFDAIKANGYKWNAETKTLEKLIGPKFKVGDVIQDIDIYKVKITEVNIEDECYGYESMIAKGIGSIGFSEQDNWKLVPDKFDITTLIPFESRVLIRDGKTELWSPAIWGCLRKNEMDVFPYIVVGGLSFNQCIPYEDNKHLLGTTDDCDEYFKTWE